MSTDQLVAARPPVTVKRPSRPPERGHPRRSDFRWGIAFIVPYAAVLFAFIVDAVLDRDLPRCPDDHPARHL
jgi:hypothetical protein